MPLDLDEVMMKAHELRVTRGVPAEVMRAATAAAPIPGLA